MKLIQIKLSGFKSFVDHTVIEIKGKLIGIVGPNGCGKSNVIDAVRWVLGESSAKQLRGELMQDVIFNGSTNRKPVSRASVELVLANDGKILTGLWNNYAELSIRRLISRQGESIYFINNQIVRRKDVTDLFSGTGVGSKGYAVIEQGMIVRILEAKPEDLRLYLEEAAGVSKYREKRKETVMRLQDTRENLQRIEDIQSELAKQIANLTVQAKVAKEYQEVQQKLNQMQLLQILLKVNTTNLLLNDINVEVTKLDNEVLQANNALATTNALLDQEYAIKQQKEAEANNLTCHFNGLRTNLARLEERQKHCLELSQRLAKDKQTLTNQLSNLNDQLVEFKTLSDNLKQESEKNAKHIWQQQVLKEQQSKEINEVKEKYLHANLVFNNLVGEINGLQHELELLNNTLSHKTNQQNNLTLRLKKLEQETSSQSLDFSQPYIKLKQEIADILQQINVLSVELAANKEQLHKVEENKTKLFEQIHNTKIQLSTTKSKIATLTQLLVKSNVAKQLDPKVKNSLPLWQNIVVTKGYELAVEVVLGNLLNALVMQQLTNPLALAKQKLSIWLESSQLVSVNKNSLANFVQLKNDKLTGLYQLLNQYQVYADLKQAIAHLALGQKMVTCDGHLITPNYVIFNANTQENHVLQYQNQLEELNHELALIETQLSKLEQAYTVTKQHFDKLKQTKDGLEQSLASMIKQQHLLQMEQAKQEQIYLQTKRHQERIIQEISLLKQEIVTLTQEITTVQAKIKVQTTKLESKMTDKQIADANKMESEAIFNLANAKLNEIERQISQTLVNNQFLKQKADNFTQVIKDKQQQIIGINQQLETVANEIKNIKQENYAEELILMQQEIAKVVADLEAKQANLQQLNQVIANLRNQLAKLTLDKEKLNDKLNKMRLKQQEQTILLNTYQENLANFNYNEDEVTKLIAANTLTLDKLNDQIVYFTRQISLFGLVNLKAIEDLADCQDKHNTLLNQVNDLTTAISTLESAIKQIDQETRRLLTETYTKVEEHFTIYFKTLFGGGTAKLELTQTDILSAGLYIFAQPPGKKNSSIHLLSGGEKALTAMSLIFALFSLNPSPFCLLDEVDAPLDDANTTRFCNLVKKLSVKTQFIYISHNRLTMEMADQLIGITMQEKGISTTVSLNLVDAMQQVG